MQMPHPTFLGIKTHLRALPLWLAMGIVCLLVYVWPISNIQAQPKTKQDTPPAQTTKPTQTDTFSTKPTKTDTFSTKPTKTDTFSTKPKPDPNQPPPDWVTPSGDSTKVLDDFEYPKHLGSFPDEIWEGRSGIFSKADKDEVYYQIKQEENNHYLAAETTGVAVNFGREAKFERRGRETKANLRLYQKLRWRWRVHSLPKGSDEREGNANDSAAAVRLIFRSGMFSGKSLKYIWSETLPVGTVIESRGQYMVVLRSGNKDLGKWVWEEVNAYEDYRRLFGGDPRAVDVLGLLTDSDNTKTFVKADYDDITFIIPRPIKNEMVPDFMLDNP